MAVYDDKEVAEKVEFIPLWKPVIENAIVRPSAPTKTSYNEVSSEIWTAAHDVLEGKSTGTKAVAKLAARLKRLKGSGWK